MTVANLFGALEGPELIIILLIVLLLFGGAKLPQLARSLGQAKREFHDATSPDAQPLTNDSFPGSDAVTISRAELDRLRTAAEQRPSDSDGPLHKP